MNNRQQHNRALLFHYAKLVISHPESVFDRVVRRHANGHDSEWVTSLLIHEYSRFFEPEFAVDTDDYTTMRRTLKAMRRKMIEEFIPQIPEIVLSLGSLRNGIPESRLSRWCVAGFLRAFEIAETLEFFCASARFYGMQNCRKQCAKQFKGYLNQLA